MTTLTHEHDAVDLAPAIDRLTKDIRSAAKTLSPREARYLVDTYYQMQEQRKRAGNQALSMGKSGEPHTVIDWLFKQSETLETRVKSILDAYSETSEVGRWSRSIVGIGPVIAAGLMAHIDIAQAPTVGHVWRFAGLDPTQAWGKGQKRPWNASLKTLCWKIGESFTKCRNREGDFYGHIFYERKCAEIARNLRGEYAEQAASALEGKKWRDDAESRAWYAGEVTADHAREHFDAILSGEGGKRPALKTVQAGEGTPMLPPAHIHRRAQRYAAKLFLAHWHEVAYVAHHGEQPPLPYPVAHLGHAHKIEPPK